MSSLNDSSRYNPRHLLFSAICLSFPLCGFAQTSVPEAPPPAARVQGFHDSHFGVRFRVPAGWTVQRKDREVSTFHLDARTATPDTQMRSVAAIQFNPYPYSTFSGALFYFSVQKHATDVECARQASAPAAHATEVQETQLIDGMSFSHGHDEHGKICVEARDEVYTAYRKGSCYRFDLAMNTFCSISSGAADLTDSQIEKIDEQMGEILSTVQLDWIKNPHDDLPARVPVSPAAAPAEPRVPFTPLMTQAELQMQGLGPTITLAAR